MKDKRDSVARPVKIEPAAPSARASWALRFEMSRPRSVCRCWDMYEPPKRFSEEAERIALDEARRLERDAMLMAPLGEDPRQALEIVYQAGREPRVRLRHEQEGKE